MKQTIQQRLERLEQLEQQHEPSDVHPIVVVDRDASGELPAVVLPAGAKVYVRSPDFDPDDV